MSTSSPLSVSEFLATLPVTYRTVFDSEAVTEHAAIVSRRSGSHYFEVWRGLPDELYVLCLVAEDRPGLLSTITTALTAVGFHIEGAQIFTRKSTFINEALDFFWVRLDPPATLEDVHACVQQLNVRLHGQEP
jgi:[protein-PII] uridylyltransferase